MAILKIEHLGIAVKNAADSKSVFEKLFMEAYLSASGVPSQAGNIKRICVQAKTQGIALSPFMLSIFFRFEGLEPIDNFARDLCGVIVLKYLIKSSLSLIFFLYADEEISLIFSINILQSFLGLGGGINEASITDPI
jgi:hypothetical protein